MDRVLFHPWTTRLGAIQALLAVALLVAGLVGGIVTFVLDFPTLWAIITAMGAALLVVLALPSLWRRFRVGPEGRLPVGVAEGPHFPDRLDELIREGDLLASQAPADGDAVDLLNFKGVYNNWAARVQSQLLLHAPEWLHYFKEPPDEVDNMLDATEADMRLIVPEAVRRLRHIRKETSRMGDQLDADTATPRHE